jgi:hypothetical protein
MDRLYFRLNAPSYGDDRRPTTPVHLNIKEESKMKSGIASFMMKKIG